MSTYFRARRKRGACYGTLWKQHSSVSTPPNLNAFKEGSAAAENALNKNGNSIRVKRVYTSGSTFLGNGRSHEIGAPSSSVDVLTAALGRNERGKCYEFCVLIGNTLTCFENLTSFRRGDDPSSEVRIVGASAWNPQQSNAPTSPSNSNTVPTFRLLTHAGTHIYCSAQTSSDRDIWLAALHSGLEITYAGFQDTLITLSSLSSAYDELHDGNDDGNDYGNDYGNGNDNDNECKSNKSEKDNKKKKSLTKPKLKKSLSISKNLTSTNQLEPTILTPPIPKRKTQIAKFVHRLTKHVPSIPSATIEFNPFLNPYETSTAPPSKVHCISCGRYPPEDAIKSYTGTPLTQYGMENVVNVCQPCLIGQGLLRHVSSITGLYVSDAHERVALVKGRDLLDDVMKKVKELTHAENNKDGTGAGTGAGTGTGGLNPDVNSSLADTWPNQNLVDAIYKLLIDPNFAACRRRSRTLDHISNQLSTNDIDTAEFIEVIYENAKHAIIAAGGAVGVSSSSNSRLNETMIMKKEALLVAGDMRAAIDMFHENALPKSSSGGGYGISTSSSQNGGVGTEMLNCVLEFFLDLCEQGELSSIAFFWTQICQIHMQMLPPTDTESLIRVELVEDFLLTVCTRYSVHLALELVWSCVADLEDSIGAKNTPSPSCRRRRFAMLRFVSELESLLFDMDGGWGGGGVCLRGMLSTSEQQSVLIQDAMDVLQIHRRYSSHHLSRSSRLDKLRSEAEAAEDSSDGGRKSTIIRNDESLIDAAERKYKVARNAEYFSTQLMFCRRLGDIAERLRFMDVDERKDALKEDLDMLNASGRLGGDPLNRICDVSNGLVNVMYIPSTEGHVFRSKERTPVLLLMEIISDEKIFENTPNSPKRVLSISDDDLLPYNSKSESKGKEKSDDGSTAIMNVEDDLNNRSRASSVCESKEGDTLSIASEKHDDSDMLGLSRQISQSSVSTKPSPKQGVLKSPKLMEGAENEAKEEVENLVATMVQEQIKHVSIPDLGTATSNDSFLSCNSEEANQQLSNNNEDDKSYPESGGSDALGEKNDDDCLTVIEENSNCISNRTETTEVAGVGSSDSPQVEKEDISFSNKADETVADTQNVENDKCHPESDGNDVLHEKNDDDCLIVIEKNNMENEVLSSDVTAPTQAESSTEEKNVTPSHDADHQSAENVNAKEVQDLIDFPGTEECIEVFDQDNALQKERTGSVVDEKSNASIRSKVSAFGSFTDMSNGSSGQFNLTANLAANGEGRRQVLNTIFVKGMRSSNLIARGVAPAAARAVQAMDRKRAQLLMNANNRGKNGDDSSKSKTIEGFSSSIGSLGLSGMDNSLLNDLTAKPSEEDECIEAVRLLLVQNKVALGKLSPEAAVLAMQRSGLDKKSHGGNEQGDAGKIDSRLAGCGEVSNAVLSAIRLWKENVISNGELLELVQKDHQFTHLTLPGAKNETILKEDSAFWGRFAFGERWAEKKARIQSSSKFGAQVGWDLNGVIVKSNDDLRQEAFAMQLIELSKEAFELAGLELWIHPYRILATGRTTGIIEMVRNAMSFDALKKRPGYSEGGLLGHFKKMTEHAADPIEALLTSKRNFVRSLAAYSLLSYFFEFKDRHNGNLLLDTAGHVIHIDFGFMFGIAPGGTFSLEQSVPFKLTEEMIEVMDGLGSVLFSEFVTLFCCGFLALQAHCETFVTIVKITCEGSTFHCFEGKDLRDVIFKLRERFCPSLNKEATIAHAMELIRQATNALGTKQYDFFQYLSQGIAA